MDVCLGLHLHRRGRCIDTGCNETHRLNCGSFWIQIGRFRLKLQRFSRVCFFLSLLSALFLPTSAFAFPELCTGTPETTQIKVASVELVKGGRNDRTAVIKTNDGRRFDLGPDLSAPEIGSTIRITYCPQTAEITTWRSLTKGEKWEAGSHHESDEDRDLIRVLLAVMLMLCILGTFASA